MNLLTRSLIKAYVASLLLGLLAGLWVLPPRSRAEEPALFFAATGQRLGNEHGFLGYWRAANGPLTLGMPISAPLVEGGLTVQYFERGRLELHPQYLNAVLRGRLGAEYSAALWRSFDPPSNPDQPGLRLFAETGHTLGAPFIAFWEANGALDGFGYPISEPLWEYVGATLTQVQYFERARLEHDHLAADPAQAVRISDLGRELALLRGIPTTPASPTGALVVDSNGVALPAPPPIESAPAAPAAPEAAPTARPAPAPAAQPARPAINAAGKAIVVDLSAQWLYAYEGGTLVFDAPVSTGRDGFNTPVGTYAIYHKVRSQTMRGCAGGECWEVPNVPHAMYIVGGVALHGTYWHNQFGSGVRRSHGCVNLPLNSAAWLYGWAPLGTPVTVRW